MTEIITGNPIYTVKNKKNELLNIRICDKYDNILWNAKDEKRYWVASDLYQAIAQAALLNTKEGENATVVAITEVQIIKNEEIVTKD